MSSLKQQGVALVTVLLIVAIATILAVAIIEEQRASLRATQSYLARGQTLQFALGGEELARQILHEDFADSTGRDYIGEIWSDPELHFEFEDGEVNLQITDLQGLFNLNSISDQRSQQAHSRFRLNNLVAALGGDVTFLDRIQDWVDADDSSRPAGAEDFDYLAYEPPYRAANLPMLDTSELILTGLPAEFYHSLMPHISVLPDTTAPLNINTATPAVLQSLAPGLSYESAETLALARFEQEGFETVESFLQSPELAGLGISAEGLGVQSSFFEVRIIARYQDRFSYLTSTIHRHAVTGVMKVIKRDFSRNFRPVSASQNEEGDG